jgi:tRNA(fMet)-specific endonuclease VapC
VITVLDTTAFSAAMRHEPDMLEFLRSRRPGDLATVPPVVAEIEYGIQRLEPGSRRRGLLEAERDRLLAAVTVLPWTEESSRRFGACKAQLEGAGVPVDDFDIAIGAIALSHDAEVVTANLPHFSRLKGLACRHWTGRPG